METILIIGGAGIARIFNTFGPYMRQNDGRAIPNFICQAPGSEPLTVFGNGKQARSFCCIDDLVQGIRMVYLIIRLAQSKSKIEFRELPQDDPHVRQPDIHRAKKFLGW